MHRLFFPSRWRIPLAHGMGPKIALVKLGPSCGVYRYQLMGSDVNRTPTDDAVH